MNSFNIKILLSSIRSLMVPLGVLTLVFDYTVAGLVQGLLIQILAPELGFWSYLISAAIQLTRAILVFIPFMDSDRPVMGYTSEIVTGLMGGIAIYEIIHLNGAGALHTSTTLSLCVLMVMCFGVEFYLLKSIKHRAQDEFFASPRKLKGLQEKVINKSNYQIFIAELQAAASNKMQQVRKRLDSQDDTKPGGESTVIKYKSIVPNGTKASVEG